MSINSQNAQTKSISLILIVIIMFVSLAKWAGIPRDISPTAFWVGVGIFAFSIILFGSIYWHLLLRPLPKGHKAPSPTILHEAYRRLLALLVGISGINVVVGGFWDEVWHRVYGIPFGEDLFWRPHLMIYSGFGLVSLLAFAGLLYILRRSKGSLQQRFRANPVIGMLVLIGGFLVYALPADPLWHAIYGEDISAFSLPHLVLAFSFILIMILAVAIQQSTVKKQPWRLIHRLSRPEWFILLTLSFVLTVGLQIMTTEWDSVNLASRTSQSVFWQRPEWLLPAIITILAGFVGTLTNHTLRISGGGTAAAVIALTIRLGLIQLMDTDVMRVSGWVSVIPMLISIDLFYGFWVYRKKNPGVLLAAAVGLLGWLATVQLINQLYVYPKITAANILPITMICAILLLIAAWIGQMTGSYLSAENKQLDHSRSSRPILKWIPTAAFAAVVLFIVIFVITAAPPV